MMSLEGNDGNHNNKAYHHTLRSSPTTYEHLDPSMIPEDNESNDGNDGSDTSRVVDSATSYARECLQTENYTEATIALRSVLEISNPTSTSFKVAVLYITQLLKAAQQLDASIDCMLVRLTPKNFTHQSKLLLSALWCGQQGLYQSMPSPFSHVDGICIIARLYQDSGSVQAAQFWKNKLPRSYFPDALGEHNVQLWETMADRFFNAALCVFAADFYAEAVAAGAEKHFVPSIRFRHRYLVSLLSFVGPQGPTAHKNLCTSVAWSLAQWFRRRNGSAAHLSDCYGDLHFYRIRQVYYASFPAIYRVVFVWVDGPAGRIGRWWRRLWAKSHRAPSNSTVTSAPPSVSRAKRKTNKKQTQHPALLTRDRPTQAGLRGKLSAPSPTSPSLTRKPHTSNTMRKKTKAFPRRHISTEPGRRTKEFSNLRSENMDTKQQVDTRALSNNASSTDEAQTFRPEQADSTPAKRREYVKTRAATKKSSEFGKQSPTKRKPSVLKRLRGDLPNGRPSPAGVENGSPSDKSSMTRSSSTSLLDVYSLRLSRTEDFVTVCGEPGFADLDLDEVSEFARLAHYRARVLAGKHARVDNLDTKTVKPQWLQDLERAVVLVETQQQRNLVSGKVVIESDSITLLSEVHTRLVLQVTTVWRQYTRDFGESSFTRRLRTLTRRLVDWKFTRISEVVAALCEAKSTAMQEEKHRNLEFYHVHHSRQLNE